MKCKTTTGVSQLLVYWWYKLQSAQEASVTTESCEGNANWSRISPGSTFLPQIKYLFFLTAGFIHQYISLYIYIYIKVCFMPTWLHIKQYNDAIIKSLGLCDLRIISGAGCLLCEQGLHQMHRAMSLIPWWSSRSCLCNKYIPMWCIFLYKLQEPGLKSCNRWFYA